MFDFISRTNYIPFPFFFFLEKREKGKMKGEKG